MIRLIDTALLDQVSTEAQQSPRLRRNRNFHVDDEQPGHRLLNALEPGTYIMPHRHLDTAKDETLVVLRGRVGLVIFDDGGSVVATAVLGPAGAALGADLPHGTWHTLICLESGSVFLEAKAGPYRPLADAEKAPWAPAEGAPGAADYLSQLARRFG
jgi:cupin fold WbuC family metalloprotein